MDINTGPFADLVTGTAQRDRINSDGGDDTVFALSGDDFVRAGTGNDVVFAASGNDVVFAGPGDDRAEGGLGRDLLFGEGGNDTLNGFDGNDVLIGGVGVNTLDGGAGEDILLVNPTDTARGGAGADLFFVDLSGFPAQVPSLPDFNAAEGDRVVSADPAELAALAAGFQAEAEAAGLDPNGGGVVFAIAAFKQALPVTSDLSAPIALRELGSVPAIVSSNVLRVAQELPTLEIDAPFGLGEFSPFG